MGNIPLSLNCICPPKDDDDDDDIKDIKKKIHEIEYKDIPMINTRLTELENNNKKLTDLDYKLSRLEDKIDMRFEMLFLNLKIDKIK
jgi:hypothetical protein